MSDSILRIIPSEPAFVPGADAQQSATSLVRDAFPHADDIAEMPQDFARFVVDVVNPDTADIPVGLEARLRDVLGCELRFVWAHF